jgi:PPOX class probable F420-dependent enzyme
MELKDIGNPTYIALETFRKSGEGVVTPVWVVAEGDKLYVWTVDGSGKIKRIRNNARVRIAVSDSRGKPKSEWVEAQAHVLDDPAEEAKQRKRTAAKYGLMFQMFSLMSKFSRDKSPHVSVEISAP